MSNTVTQLPPTITVSDPGTRQFLDALVNILDLRSGVTDAGSQDRFLTARDLNDAVANAAISAAGGASSAPSTTNPQTTNPIAQTIENLQQSIQQSLLYQIMQNPIELIDLDKFQGNIDSALQSASAGIANEETTRIGKDNALAQAVNTLWASVGGSEALIQDGQLASITPAAVEATKWTQVQAAVTDPNTGLVSSTSIKEDLLSYASLADGSLNSIYSVRAQVTTGGRTVVGGFGLAATDGAGSIAGPTIDFGVLADTFWIGAIDGTGGIPFIVRTTAEPRPDGTTTPAGTYIKSAFVDQLYGTYINAGLLDAAKIYTGSTWTDKTSNLPVRSTASGSWQTDVIAASAPVTNSALRFYGPSSHSSTDIFHRLRGTSGGNQVQFTISASAVADHYFSLWYRVNAGSWVFLGQVIEPQTSYGSVAMSVTKALDVAAADYIDIGVAACDSTGAVLNSSADELRSLTVIATAINV